jgi:hypothetical protein
MKSKYIFAAITVLALTVFTFAQDKTVLKLTCLSLGADSVGGWTGMSVRCKSKDPNFCTIEETEILPGYVWHPKIISEGWLCKNEKHFSRTDNHLPAGERFSAIYDDSGLRIDSEKETTTEFNLNLPPHHAKTEFNLPPLHANTHYIGCVVTKTLDSSVKAECRNSPDETFPTQPSWRWPIGLRTKPNTQFYYETTEGGRCRTVYSPSDHAIVFDDRRATPNCDE